MPPPVVGIYIHIPFCQTRCNYCHFVTRPLEDAVAARYNRALIRELEHFFQGRESLQADTVYFGGGTPSIVRPEYIALVLATCRRFLDLSAGCEITLEANPGTLTAEKVQTWREAGVNRVSMGAQSFQDAELEAIGRVHDAADIVESVSLLRAYGFGNVNLDLMAGLPDQAEEQWTANLTRMTEIAPEHISMYMLDLDSHSPLYHSVAKGIVRLPDEDQVADFYLEALSRFEASGYVQYEISNFARPGRESRHNLKYWLRKPVLGFGVASHSYDGAVRYANYSNLNTYLEAIEAGGSAIEWRKPEESETALQEELFLGLRLARGVDWDQVRGALTTDQLHRYEQTLAEMTSLGLMQWNGSVVRLTVRGMLLSNEIFQRFV